VTSDERDENHVVIDPADLSPAALEGLVQEFVSREGTDYGHRDRSLEEKVADVMRQLNTGEARIVFDLASETSHIVTARDLERY
jgi:uncharacterized protein YheU (UPF0270 family)